MRRDALRLDSFGACEVGLLVEDLTLEVGRGDDIAVDDGDAPDACSREVVKYRSSQAPSANDCHARLSE